jgi:hypothetical protein
MIQVRQVIAQTPELADGFAKSPDMSTNQRSGGSFCVAYTIALTRISTLVLSMVTT